MGTTSPDVSEFMAWTWQDFEQRYQELEARELTEDTAEQFLRDWTALADRAEERQQRLQVAADANTSDVAVATALQQFLEEITPRIEEAHHALQAQFLDSGLRPRGMDVALRSLAADAGLFQEANLPLQTEEAMLVRRYFEITGAQTIAWDGEEIPLSRVQGIMEDPDRARREDAWRRATRRRLEDRVALNDTWKNLLRLRIEVARNAGLPDFRAYRWQALHRFDYTPEDALEFDRAVERVVVPIVARLHRERKERLGVEVLRPWDRDVDLARRPPLVPFRDTDELIAGSSRIFHRVDPVLGGYFDTMVQEGLLDLDSRANKSPGGYCIGFDASRRPFIFMQGSKTHWDVETVLHEGGHAFHVFESANLPYYQQRTENYVPMEFAEVASMAMELLAEPYLTKDEGGFYSVEDTRRVRRNHLLGILTLWCFLAMTDLFQHWIYEHPEEAADPERMDAEWTALRLRFLPEEDWSGLERERGAQWQEILHIFVVPFYIIEYSFAQLGAIQLWANSLQDPAGTIARYRHALSLGSTRTLPELFAAAGVRFAFDEQTLRNAVGLIERTLAGLEG